MNIIRASIFALSFAILPMLCYAAEPATITNPLKDTVSNIPDFIAQFLKVMVKVGLPIVAFFMLIAGYKFASAGGNEHKIESAKENLVWVVIGACFILGAWVIATLIGNTVTEIVGL